MREILSIGQVADLFQVHRVTIWRWVKAGEFPKPDINISAHYKLWKRETVEQVLATEAEQEQEKVEA